MNVTAPSFDDIVDDTAWLFQITATCVIGDTGDEDQGDRLPEVDVVNPDYLSVIPPQAPRQASEIKPGATHENNASTASVTPTPDDSASIQPHQTSTPTSVLESRRSPSLGGAKPDYEKKKQLAQIAIADTDASKVRRPNRYAS
jgi:hypothetical protein